MTTVAFYGVLWAEGANDVIADHLDIPLYTITWIARFSVFLGAVVHLHLTKRICLGLQRADLHDCCTAWRPASSASCRPASSSRSTSR